MVPEGVRRLFQVLTGEDMTDADEGGLFAVADALESGAVGVGEVGAFVAELVGKVRTEFSGKAADRFAGGLEIFDRLLASGERMLRELAVFVRDLARQVRYLKLVTIHSLELLALEIAWAVYSAAATGGASMAWLAARMAVMRMLLSRWWGQLFKRLAMAAAGGVAFNVVPDMQAQLQMLGEKSSEKWDGKLSEQAAGMGAFSALVSLPLSAVGGLVSNALTKVLVRGLGDEVDEKILEAAARKAVAEHAELYPVSAMARFADVVAKHLDVYAGMSVRGMWSARFGHGVGETLENALSELFGEVGYQSATGQAVTWNPFSVTAGFFESVFSGVGTVAGLALRGKLVPEGPSPYLNDTGHSGKGSANGDAVGGEETLLREKGSESQTGDAPGSPDLGRPSDSPEVSDTSEVSEASDVDSAFSAPGELKGVGAGKAGILGDSDALVGERGKESVLCEPESIGQSMRPVSRHDGDATAPWIVAGFGQDRPGTPPPAYTTTTQEFGQDRLGTPPSAYTTTTQEFEQDRAGTPPPAYSPIVGTYQAVYGVPGADVPSGSGDQAQRVKLGARVQGPSAETPRAPGLPSDAAQPKATAPAALADPTGGPVFGGREQSLGDTTRRGVDSGADSTAGSGVRNGDSPRPDGHAPESLDSSVFLGGRSKALEDQVIPGAHVESSPAGTSGHVVSTEHEDVVVVQEDSNRSDGEPLLPVDESQVSPTSDAGVAGPSGLPPGTVLVPVPAEAASVGVSAAQVRSSVGDTGTTPVLLVSQVDPNSGVVLSRRQASNLARTLGGDVVALVPGHGERGPRWMRFRADGSRPKPVGEPRRKTASKQTAEQRGDLGALANASTAVPTAETLTSGEMPSPETASGVVGDQPMTLATATSEADAAQERLVPAADWSESDLRAEIEHAKAVAAPSDVVAAKGIVWHTHDVRSLARQNARVPLADVVALVAAQHPDRSLENHARAGELSQTLAEKLGTEGNSLRIRAGAGSSKPSGVDLAWVAESDRSSIVEVSRERVFKATDRAPADVTKNGFAGGNDRITTIYDHTYAISRDQYVSTTEDSNYHHKNLLYRYVIDPPVTGISVVETLKAQNKNYWVPWEREILYRHIGVEDIIGWYEYEEDSNSLSGISLVRFVRHEGYRGNKDAPLVV
ncbi:WXG100-like domain-containing protein [Saccharopolyspora pogona]